VLPLGWYAVVFVVAVTTTALATWPAISLATTIGYVDVPKDRKVHARVTPYGGGAAMFVGFCVAMATAAALPAFRPLFHASAEALGVVFAATAIFVVGLIDDLRDMSAPAKMAGQVLAASILYFCGATMYQFHIPLTGQFVVLSPSIIPLVTAVWVIALTNAVNLIDGLDGLASGIVAIGSAALALYGLKLEGLGLLPLSNIGPLIAIIACGICLGFLVFNFHPAKIFMGDAGALFLGLLLSASTMVIGGRTPPASGITYFFFAPLFLPFFILGIPILDMVMAFIRRTAKGTGFSTADKDHIHHRLLRLGHGHRRAVLTLWAWTAVLSSLVLTPLFIPSLTTVVPFAAIVAGIGLVLLFWPDQRSRAVDEPIEPPAPALVVHDES
jgi:UDP-GlcNAc:undecaprenyl-phosphate/decaprenyl-phosphate GlcNAc-1-phosphate transferase